MFSVLLLILINFVKTSSSACPMNHAPCDCNVTQWKNFELSCRNLKTSSIEKALANASLSSDYLLTSLVMDNVDFSATKLDVPFKYCSQITKLTLVNNSITNFDAFGCKEMKNVRNLTIVGSPLISVIDDKFFSKFSKLTSLFISKSNIKKIEKSAFEKFNSTLKSLSLVDCKLVEFPTSAVLSLRMLKDLSFRDNEIGGVTNESALALDKNLDTKLLILNKLECNCTLWTSILRMWANDDKLEGLTCKQPHFDSPLMNIRNMTKEQFCPPSNISSSYRNFKMLFQYYSIILFLIKFIIY